MRQLSEADRSISEQSRLHILIRDSWRCQVCGSMSRLEVHHQVFRSHGGEDSDENLIVLCHECHMGLHARRTDVE